MKAARPFLLAYALLLLLLAGTVAGAHVELGAGNIILSLGIAAAKAALIFWFFMHLKEGGALLRLIAVAAVLWLLIMFALSMADYATRPLLSG